jgi:internalin A
VLRFVTEEPAEAGDLLAFKFDRWTDGLLARLPVPAVPFGLDLSNTEVTDAGLGELARLSGLQALSLSWTKVTDAGLGELARLSGLQALSLWRTSVTSAGVAKLQQALRGCSIIH